jgi:hypothetical protein
LAASIRAQSPAVTEVHLADDGRVALDAAVPAGYGYAVLEWTGALAQPAWRAMIGTTLDGRGARVSFRLPRPAGAAHGFVRVRVGVGTSVPAVELTDPTLVAVAYPGGGPSEGDKIATLATLGAFSDTLEALPEEDRRAQVVARARTLPGVSHAGVAALTGNVWIRYSDGDRALLIEDRTPPPGGVVELPEPAAAGVRPRLPAALDAVCGFSVDFFMPDSTKLVSSWLNKSGYLSMATNVVTVDKLLTWQNLGVFFWQAHCGADPIDPDNPQAGYILSVLTQQPATEAASLGRFKDMRANGELILGRPVKKSAWPPGVDPPPFYCVSEKFIANRMRFADRSLVALDACMAGLPQMGAAFLKANAGAYVSWDDEACEQSGTVFRQMFDRLLGKNAEAPFSTPKERPFALPYVQHWMQDKGFDTDPAPCNGFHAALNWYFAADAKKKAHILLPTIFRVLYEANDPQFNFTKFLIEGDFDPDYPANQGVVTWGDQVLTVLDWTKDSIRVKAPAPPYPVGDIQVIIGNRRSNAVPLTEWTMPFTYTLNGKGTLQYVIQLNVKLRGDARGTRELPQEPINGMPLGMWELADCTGTVSASGQYNPNPDTTIRWSGGSSIKSADSGFSQISASSGVSFGTSTLEGFILSAFGTFTVSVNSESQVVAAGLDGFLNFIFPPWNRPFDPVSFALPSGSMASPFPPTFENGVSAEIRWSAATAQAVPTNDTPR